MEHLNRKKIMSNDLVTIGCGGCNVNTGVGDGELVDGS